jgi:transposase
MSTPRRRYTQEFKDQLVQEVIEFSKPIAQVAQEYGIAAQSLGNWVKKYRETLDPEAPGEATAAGKTAREHTLEREVQELKAELAFVKKAYFARDPQ